MMMMMMGRKDQDAREKEEGERHEGPWRLRIRNPFPASFTSPSKSSLRWSSSSPPGSRISSVVERGAQTVRENGRAGVKTVKAYLASSHKEAVARIIGASYV
jgi:hypothetical protein